MRRMLKTYLSLREMIRMVKSGKTSMFISKDFVVMDTHTFNQYQKAVPKPNFKFEVVNK